MNSGFHLRDGLHFTRLENGAVRIDWCSGPNWDAPVKSLTVPENEWASVVCSVSKDGETAERWKRARMFHGTEFSELPPSGADETPQQLTAEDEEWLNAPMGTPKPPIKGSPIPALAKAVQAMESGLVTLRNVDYFNPAVSYEPALAELKAAIAAVRVLEEALTDEQTRGQILRSMLET